jgi:uncharacterized protein
VIIVSDTSPISNLIVVGYAHLLPELFSTVIIPDIVYQELLANGPHHPVTQTIQTANWLEVHTVSDSQRVIHLERDCNLDPGEANAIILALELQANQLLIDERLGRKEAKRKGQKLIPSVRPIMDALIHQSNFRIKADLYAEVLKLAAE